MKHCPLFNSFFAACVAAATLCLAPSCSSPSSSGAVKRYNAAGDVTIFSHNDVNSAKYRQCVEAGPIPARAQRAIAQWLRESTVKTFSYAYPQYFMALSYPDPQGGRGVERVWAICSDSHGNLVGIMIPRDGVAAWDLPLLGNYKMYVCDTPNRAALSEAIMTSLAEAGYDAQRINARKAAGLDEERYLISKPLTNDQQARLERLKQQEEASAKAAAAAKTSSAAEGVSSEGGDNEEATSVSEVDAGDSVGSDSSDGGSSEESGDAADSSDDGDMDM